MERWATATAYETLTTRRRERFQVEEATGRFRGLGAGFSDIVHTYTPTRLDPHCFDDTLQVQRPEAIRLLYQHNREQPIGYFVELWTSPRGLEAVGQLSRLERFHDYVQMMKDNLVSLSIGFDSEEETTEAHPDYGRIRVIKRLRLWELSLVTWPGSESARIEEVYMRQHGATKARQLADAELAWAEYVTMATKTTAQRLDDFATSELLAKSPYPDREQRPSPEREYWDYVATVRDQGRRVFGDGSFVPLSTAEAGYIAPLWAAVQRRRQAAVQRREQALYEAGCQVFAAASRQAIAINYAS